MRKLTDQELNKIAFLTSKSIEVSLLEPTSTGLNKSIMDATLNVRDFLSRKGVHKYSEQSQGIENKKNISTKIITDSSIINSSTSLYRPTTKSGDPRIWISNIKAVCLPNDIIALTTFEDELWVFNLTRLDLTSFSGPFKSFVNAITKDNLFIADELLHKIRHIASKGFIPSPTRADTSIGRLLESELGIAINSSKNPDYKGIELKTARSNKSTRNSLFAQVPDWSISRLKSSKQLLDEFGYYDSSGIKRLECTLKAGSFIPQGLSLEVDETMGLLNEISNKIPKSVLSWKISKLEERLLQKHSETFWIEADVRIVNGIEYFKFTKVKHTKDPMVSQFIILISQGKITLDHMIKANGNSAIEKGPAFKLGKNSLSLLFPPSVEHKL